jgi:hypothetical protein
MTGLRKPSNKRICGLLAVSTAMAIFLSCSVEALRADWPNLAGTWKLNEKKSDDVRAKMMEARRNQNPDQSQGADAGGPGGGGPDANGGPGEGPGGGPGNGSDANGGPGDGGQRGMRGGGGRGGTRADFSKLTIEQTATTAKVSGASGRVLAVLGPDAAANASPDNSAAAPAHVASPEDMPANSDAGPRPRRGPPPPAVAHWNGNQLVSESQSPRGGKMTRTYELSPDGKELFVNTKLQNPNLSEPISYRQVYDRAKAN